MLQQIVNSVSFPHNRSEAKRVLTETAFGKRAIRQVHTSTISLYAYIAMLLPQDEQSIANTRRP